MAARRPPLSLTVKTQAYELKNPAVSIAAYFVLVDRLPIGALVGNVTDHYCEKCPAKRLSGGFAGPPPGASTGSHSTPQAMGEQKGEWK